MEEEREHKRRNEEEAERNDDAEGQDDNLDRKGAGGDRDDAMLHATRDVLAEGEKGEAKVRTEKTE